MGNSNDPMIEIYKLLSSGSKDSLSDIIKDKRSSMGDISDNQIAVILNIPKTTFYTLMKDISQDSLHKADFYDILKICQFFGIGIEEMSRLYVSSLKPEHINGLEKARKANYIINNFDLKGLKESGFLTSSTDLNYVEKRITKFFGLESITQYGNEIGAVAFSRTKRNSQDKMREFWVRSAIYQFEKIDNKNPYNRDELFSLIAKIAPYSRYVEKGFLHVLQALYNIGITVIVQSYLSKTQVRGGTFCINGRPCIVITDFNKSYPHLWFSLMHELYHVLYDFDQLKTLNYHLTGEPQSELFLFREDAADDFGWEMMFPKEKRDFIRHLIKSEVYVNNYAKENMVHPGIIYAAYCEELSKQDKNEYGFYRTLFGKSDKAINHIKCNPWNKEEILVEVDKIKSSLTIKI